jgi:hypothetical protein
LRKATSEFLSELSLDDGVPGLYSAAAKARELAQGELDRPVAGALHLLRLALLTIANQLADDPSPELWEEQGHVVTALAIFVRNRDPASLNALAEVC